MDEPHEEVTAPLEIKEETVLRHYLSGASPDGTRPMTKHLLRQPLRVGPGSYRQRIPVGLVDGERLFARLENDVIVLSRYE